MRRLTCLTTALLLGVSTCASAAAPRTLPAAGGAADTEEAVARILATFPSCDPEAWGDEEVIVTGTKRQATGMPSPSIAMEARPALAAPPSPRPPAVIGEVRDTSRFYNGDQNPVNRVLDQPVSTFSADVDTASYAVSRRYLRDCELPPSESVRVEEFINAFDYGYALPPSAELPFRPDVEVFPTPWNDGTELLRIGIKGYDLIPEETPPANIVLLLDVSGSMNRPDKLPLLKESMKLLVNELDEDDRVGIVVYAGAAGAVLAPTPGNEKDTIISALDRLEAGGSTAGGAGLALAYDLAAQNFDPKAVNRIILATDGDFNVGVTGDDPLTDFVARKREEGIYLSILGFGRGNLNDQLMQTLAQNGNGTAAYIDSIDEAEKVLVREFTSSIFPIAEDVKFQVEFNPAAIAEYRLIGYQTRLLDEEDFDNDQVDAGEVGSGHAVTALYEVVRRGQDGWLPERRYDDGRQAPEYDPTAELAFLKIRYKLPGAEESLLIERPITPADRARSLRRSSADSRFAAAVAAFGETLARSDYINADFDWARMEALATAARGEDPYLDQARFIALLRRAAEVEERDRQAMDEDGDGN